MQTEEAEYVPLLEELKVTATRPLEPVSGAMRGTEEHFIMQSADPKAINSVDDVKALINRMAEQKVITKAQANSVDPYGIYGFFAGELGSRMKCAKRLEREFSFYTKAKIDEIYHNGIDGEILLQGTMDCFFEEADGRIVLLDFKTDRAKSRDAAVCVSERYKVQIKYYKQALSEILGRSVDECYLYFLDCGEAIQM